MKKFSDERLLAVITFSIWLYSNFFTGWIVWWNNKFSKPKHLSRSKYTYLTLQQLLWIRSDQTQVAPPTIWPTQLAVVLIWWRHLAGTTQTIIWKCWVALPTLSHQNGHVTSPWANRSKWSQTQYLTTFTHPSTHTFSYGIEKKVLRVWDQFFATWSLQWLGGVCLCVLCVLWVGGGLMISTPHPMNHQRQWKLLDNTK